MYSPSVSTISPFLEGAIHEVAVFLIHITKLLDTKYDSTCALQPRRKAIVSVESKRQGMNEVLALR